MKNKLSPNTVGLVLGGCAGGFHLMWAILVSLGLAQPFLDWIFSLHFLDNPYVVAEFQLQTAIILVAVTFGIGYIAGWVFATAWNWLNGKK